MLDQDGYLKLIDFGLATVLRLNQVAYDSCGTPEYMAPESVKCEGSNFSADWWSVGVIMYEMLFGVTPFKNNSKSALFHGITSKDVTFPNQVRVPHSDEFEDLVSQLLNRNIVDRIGSEGGAQQIMAHPWFAGFDFTKLLNKEIKPELMDKAYLEAEDGIKFFNSKRGKNALK